MDRQLAAQGTSLDGIYFCPDAPSGEDRTVVENPNRKPGPGMLLQAAADLGLELANSWMIGDMISDVLAGINAGCRSILIGSDEPNPAGSRPRGHRDALSWLAISSRQPK